MDNSLGIIKRNGQIYKNTIQPLKIMFLKDTYEVRFIMLC